MLVELYLDGDGLLLHVGANGDVIYAQLLPLRLQFDAADDAVPVALRLVGHGVRVLPYADILDTVIDAEDYLVGLAGNDVFRYIVAVRGRERHLPPHLVAVDVGLGLDVSPLQEERHAAVVPVAGNIYPAAVPRCPDIVALGRQEEGELRLLSLAILLHIRIEVVAGVVERTRPLRIHRDGVALAVGKHRAGQDDVVVELRLTVVEVGRGLHLEIPCAGKVDNLLCLNCGERQHSRREHYQS